MTRYAALDVVLGIPLSGLNGELTVTPSTGPSFCHTVGPSPPADDPPVHTRNCAVPRVRSNHVNGDPFAIVISISLGPSLEPTTVPRSEWYRPRTFVHRALVGGGHGGGGLPSGWTPSKPTVTTACACGMRSARSMMLFLASNRAGVGVGVGLPDVGLPDGVGVGVDDIIPSVLTAMAFWFHRRKPWRSGRGGCSVLVRPSKSTN